MGMESTYSLSDIKAITDNNGAEGGFGGSWMWIIVLFLFMFGRNGFGGAGGENTCASAADVQRNFDTSTIINKLDGLSGGLCDGFYAQNTTMLQGFNGVESALCNGFNNVNNNVTQARFDAQQCCCETNRNIDSVRYENAKNTCDIVNAIRTDGDTTRALINSMEMTHLRDELQAAQLTLGNAAQTNAILTSIGRYVTNPPCPPPCNPCGYNACGGFAV